MRPRLLNALALISLLLCGVTLLTACLAGYFHSARWTLTWQDRGNAIQSQLHGAAWDGSGYEWLDYAENITLGQNPGNLKAARNSLAAMTPANQPYTVPVHDIDLYLIARTSLVPVNSDYWPTSSGYVTFSSLLFLFALLPVARGSAILIRRGRLATQAEAGRSNPELTLTGRLEAMMSRTDERFRRYAHLRARCPFCSELIPRRWAWDQSPRDHRCSHCYVLLRERSARRRLGNLALILAGWFATAIAVNIAAIFMRHSRIWGTVLSAVAVIPFMTAWAYILFPYITRYQVTAPLCSKCDYTLTGTASAVCPECGAAVEFPEFVM